MTITNLPADIESLRDMTDHAGVVLEFLNGEGPLEGIQFGERHPSKRGAFWWRKELAGVVALLDALPIIDAQATRIAELEAEVARLKATIYTAAQATVDCAAVLRETDAMTLVKAAVHVRTKTGLTLVESKLAVERHRAALNGGNHE